MEQISATEARIASGEKFRIGVIVYSKESFTPSHKNESGSPLAQVTLSNGERVWIYTNGNRNGYQVCSNPTPQNWKKM